MMKNIISSPYRKMKILLILPVFAIVLYSFAKPEYRYEAPDENTGNNMPVSEMQKKVVPGTVVQQDGKPLQRAAIVVNETTPGISTDTIKHFNSNIGTPPPPPPPAPHLNSEVPLMITGTPPSPPPPPSAGITFKGGNGNPPLIIVDGVVRDIDVNKIDPNTIESISVIKGESAENLYGEKGKEGVIEITLKKGTNTVDLNTPIQNTNNEKVNLKGTAPVGSSFKIRTSDGSPINALIVIDGVISDKSRMDALDPNNVESINVLKNKSTVDKYGEKGKEGVIEITTKK